MGKIEDSSKSHKDSISENTPQLSQLEKAKTLDVKKIIIAALIIIVMGGLAGTSFYFYRQYKKASVVQLPVETRDEITVLTDEIKKFMILPDETPTLATVTDAEQARNQPFFTRAENGDKVLIYTQTRKAILYRPSVKKIVEIANVSVSTENQKENLPNLSSQTENVEEAANQVAGESKQKESETKVVRVAVYNGSSIKGLASKLAEKIERIEDIGDIEITKKTNAKGFYNVTFVADLKGGNADLCEKIARAIGGQVGVFPEEETMPDADILVIGGSAP